MRAVEGHCAVLGIGKQIDRKGSLCRVEYFDSPTSDLVIHEVDVRYLKRETISGQTRVYHFDVNTQSWAIGRLLEDYGDRHFVRFPNGTDKCLKPDELFVRWDCPIRDPTSFLANRINESPRFSDGRSAFVRSQIRQRVASMGMSAILSSAIELEAHQIDVVQRVLRDPVQRYLLADEVGLGKTIEAGVLIRQCVLDADRNCTVVVIVPPAIVSQWRRELANKFFLKRSLDSIVHVIALDDHDKIRALLPKANMLVIDEAHHLGERSDTNRNDIYAEIARATPAIDRVLLLSATPVLHNEREFLEMLHLLDPVTYSLADEESFRRKIENRQSLAEIVAGLIPENALFLDETIAQLVAMFPDDDLLQEQTAQLRIVVEAMPAEDDPSLTAAIDRLRAHLSEVYRLDRRILRHRRRSISDLTPDRSGAQIVRYQSRDRAALTIAINEWRSEEASKTDSLDINEAFTEGVNRVWRVLSCAAQHLSQNSQTLRDIDHFKGGFDGDYRFGEVVRLMGRPGHFEDRVDALIEAIRPIVLNGAKSVVFCSDPSTADNLTERIRERLRIIVDRHDPSHDGWKAFEESNAHLILVCDRRAEEGLNFQGGKKVVLHYDTPFKPNRVEQRLGRVDRYGTGDAVRSVVLACDDDPIELAWIEYLNDALKVFDRSIASLQYVIDQTVRDLAGSIFTDGVEAIGDLIVRNSGDQSLIEREMRLIDQQDALDDLGTPPGDLVDDLSEVDNNWKLIASDTTAWLDQTLLFRRTGEQSLVIREEPGSPFRYAYSTSGHHTLIPLDVFMTYCVDALDLDATRRGENIIKTIPYTFRRRSALHRDARANGVGLLRYGDPLIHGITAFTEADDRGKSFAMWRFVPGSSADSGADIFLRFDFVLEADITRGVEILAKFGKHTNTAVSAIRRRGDMALPPFHRSIWLDRELKPVIDSAVLSVLERGYQVEPDASGGRDVNLNSKRWENVLQLKFPELEYWSEFCFNGRSLAEDVLRGDVDFVKSLADAGRRTHRMDQGRLSQLRARARNSSSVSVGEELVFEEQLSAVILEGVNAPIVRVDTIGAVFVSADRQLTGHVLGGR